MSPTICTKDASFIPWICYAQKGLRFCILVLAGILTFTDKIINKETRQYIKEALGMTQVGKMLMEEGRQEEATQTTINMLKSGKFSVEEINEFVPRLSLNEIKTIAKKLNL